MENSGIHEIKKQASFFLREKFKVARLALTDVTRIQLLTEEATNPDPWGPETRTLAAISNAAFEVDEYERIVQVLNRRLQQIGTRDWRQIYKTLVVLEYLLTHGPESFATELEHNRDYIVGLSNFICTDERGIDRGLGIRNKADRILELLDVRELLKEERNRACRVSCGIRGFGSNISNSENNLESLTAEVVPREESSGEESNFLSLERHALLKEENNEKDGDENHKVSNSRVEWHLFEKSLSSPGYHRDPGTTGLVINQESKVQRTHSSSSEGASHVYKKSLSSLSYFRATSQMDWHPFSEEQTGIPVLKQSETGYMPEHLDVEEQKGACSLDSSPTVNLQERMEQKGNVEHSMDVKGNTDWHPFESKGPLRKEPPPHAAVFNSLVSREISIQSFLPSIKVDGRSTTKIPTSSLEVPISKGQQGKPHYTQQFSLQFGTQQNQTSLKPPSLPPPPHPNRSIQLSTHYQVTSLLDV